MLALAACSSPPRPPDAGVETPPDLATSESDFASPPDLTPPSLTLFPTTLTLTTAGSRGFRATIRGVGPGVTFTVVESDGGTVTADGVYTPPATAGTYHLQVASVADSLLTALATITVVAPPAATTWGTPEITTLSGFTAGEIAAIDFDNDGDLDIINAPVGDPSAAPIFALRNDGAGHFSDVSSTVVPGISLVHPRDFAVADFNGDGRKDLFIAAHGYDQPPFPGEQSRLLMQSTSGTLVDESSARIPILNRFTHHVCAGDLDGDGDVDLLLMDLNDGPHVYTNDGTGHFSDGQTGLPAKIRPGQFTACALTDVDRDGTLDMVLGWCQSNSAPRDLLLFNDGHGNFTLASDGAMPLRGLGEQSADVDIRPVDLDRDGYPDLVMTLNDQPLMHSTLQVLLNQGDGTFADATTTLGLPDFSTADNALLLYAYPADFDATGFFGLSINGDREPPRLYRYDGMHLVEVTGVMPSAARRTLTGDFDGDGRIDVFLDAVGNDYTTVGLVRNLGP